jgi:hypothetical protein
VLPVPSFEIRVPSHVDKLEIEAKLVMNTAHNLERTHTQVAVGSVVEGDASYGYRPLVVVASATRCTASP